MQAWQATMQDEEGNVVPLPVVTVYKADGTTLARIYNEDGTAKPNPFTGTIEGFCQFFAPSGRYKVVGSNAGEQTEVWDVRLARGKIFILATGQSNMRMHPSYTFVPAANAYYWNNAQGNMASVGTRFNPLTGNTASTAIGYAQQVALDNPDHDVYVLSVGLGSQPIGSWLPGADPATDVYGCIAANIGPALAAAGVTKVDRLLWWQGENGGSLPTYADDFEAVMARFASNAWFDVETPTTIFGVSETARSGAVTYDLTNFSLQNRADHKATFRKFVNTTDLTPASYWDDGIHMTGAGYMAAGRMAARAMDSAQFRLEPNAHYLGNPQAPALGSGYYRLDANTLNVPFAGDSVLSHIAHSQQNVVQEQIDVTTSRRWRRYKRGNTFTSWEMVTGCLMANTAGGGGQSVVGTSVVTVAFPNIVSDRSGVFDGQEFGLPAGTWMINASVRILSGLATGEQMAVSLRNAADNSIVLHAVVDSGSLASCQAIISGLVVTNGSTNYIVTVTTTGSGTKQIQQSASTTYLNAIAMDTGRL